MFTDTTLRHIALIPCIGRYLLNNDTTILVPLSAAIFSTGRSESESAFRRASLVRKGHKIVVDDQIVTGEIYSAVFSDDSDEP